MPGTVEVIGGVDTHTIRHCAAAIDEQGRLLGVHEFDANETGHRRLAVVVPLLASTACRAASERSASSGRAQRLLGVSSGVRGDAFRMMANGTRWMSVSA